MIQKASLWSRIGSWIKPFPQDDELPDLAKADFVSIPTATTTSDNGPARDRGTIRLTPWRRRDEMMERMQHGYDKVLDLVASIQNHLVSQNKRSDKVVELLGNLAQGMNDLPKAARHHTDTLASLVCQIEVSNSHAQSLVEMLGDWPNAAMAQREALNSISQHLRACSDATGKLADQQEFLGQTVKMLAESSSEQVRTLQAMQQASQQSDSRLAQLVHLQTKRFSMLFILMLGFTAIAVVATALSLLS